MPTREEIEKHMTTHAQFRSWCPHCVAGQAVASGHFKKQCEEEDVSGIANISMDYAFMNTGEKEEGGA